MWGESRRMYHIGLNQGGTLVTHCGWTTSELWMNYRFWFIHNWVIMGFAEFLVSGLFLNSGHWFGTGEAARRCRCCRPFSLCTRRETRPGCCWPFSLSLSRSDHEYKRAEATQSFLWASFQILRDLDCNWRRGSIASKRFARFGGNSVFFFSWSWVCLWG